MVTSPILVWPCSFRKLFKISCSIGILCARTPFKLVLSFFGHGLTPFFWKNVLAWAWKWNDMNFGEQTLLLSQFIETKCWISRWSTMLFTYWQTRFPKTRFIIHCAYEMYWPICSLSKYCRLLFELGGIRVVSSNWVYSKQRKSCWRTIVGPWDSAYIYIYLWFSLVAHWHHPGNIQGHNYTDNIDSRGQTESVRHTRVEWTR